MPGLAESWTISATGSSYTFKLRKGITFHDGTPFNAEAVKFSIERQINPEHPFNKLGKYPFADYFFGNVKAVEVVDEDTVQFVLKEPRASFLAVLTAGAASIVSPTAVRKAAQDYALTPVGTGPFRFVELGPRPAGGAGEERERTGRPGEGRPGDLPARSSRTRRG